MDDYLEKKKDANEVMFYEICDRFDISLVIWPRNDLPENIPSYYDNDSGSTFDAIMVGVYKNEDLRVIAFFHEFGHVLDIKLGKKFVNKYEMERSAWQIGIITAQHLGIGMTDEMLEYRDDCLQTYEKYKAPHELEAR